MGDRRNASVSPITSPFAMSWAAWAAGGLVAERRMRARGVWVAIQAAFERAV